MPDQKRYVVLTGAGAARPFGGPSTPEITCEIVEDSLFKARDGRTLGKYLVDRLSDDMDEDQANFETMIEIAEELRFRTYDCDDRRNGEPQFPSSLIYALEEDFDCDVLNFNLIYDEGENYYYSNGQHVAKKFSESNWFFFDRLVRHWMKIIIQRVKKYAVSCAGRPLSEKYRAFLECLQEEGTLRHYTLNYDRLVPEITSEEVFDGFGEVHDDSDVEAYRIRQPNRVRFDGDTDCAYNLHGSIFFKKRGCTDTPEIDSQRSRWVCTPEKVNLSPGFYDSDSDRRRHAMHITTGLRKPSRMLTLSNRPFYQRFGLDCADADVFIIVGYSFSDHHVNELIQERVESGEAEVWYVGHNTGLESNPWMNMDQFFIDSQTPSLPEVWGPSRPSSRISESVRREGKWFRNESNLYSLYFDGFGTFLREEDWEQVL